MKRLSFRAITASAVFLLTGGLSVLASAGPPAPGAKPLGPFYELESSSPAAALAPGKSLTHVHRTIHLQGPETVLAPVAERTLGVKLADIQKAFAP